MSKLAGYFDEKLVAPRDLAAFKAQSIRDLGSGSDDVGQTAVSAAFDISRVSYRVDYSDLSKFVFFNSALDYFNITGERLLNDYPSTGSMLDIASFVSGCDDYQRWLREYSWPATLGDNNASRGYVKTNDLLNPRTSSFSVEMWLHSRPTITGTLFRMSGPSGSYSADVRTSGTSKQVVFDVSGTSGKLSATMLLGPGELSSSLTVVRYLSFVCDRDGGELRIIHAPDMSGVVAYRDNFNFTDTYFTATSVAARTSMSLDLGTVNTTGALFYIFSGTTNGSAAYASEISYWDRARSTSDVKNSYYSIIRAQDGLVALYRFNEAYQQSGLWVVRDITGNSLDALMTGSPAIDVFSGTRGDRYISNSRLWANIVDPRPEPLTRFDQLAGLSGVLESYISTQQATCAAYDKQNLNIITDLIPASYIDLEDEIGTDVLKRFLYVIARQFDQVKVAIDQFVYWNKSNYTGFDDAPDALLRDAANFYGWDFVGNFLDEEAIRYFFGKDIVPGSELELKLYQIKNEFWRRTLRELMHIYKTKGTREGVEAFLRVYGLDSKLVKLKEYGTKREGQISTQRITSRRTVPALYMSGSSIYASSSNVPLQGGFCFSAHMKFEQFPPVMSPGYETASIWVAGAGFVLSQRRWLGYKPGLDSGSAIFFITDDGTSSAPRFSGSVPVLDGRWWNVFSFIPPTGSNLSASITLQRLDVDQIAESYTITGQCTASFTASDQFFCGNVTPGGVYYINEVKLFSSSLSQEEMDSQTFDFQSYGIEDTDHLRERLLLHWKFDDEFVVRNGITQTPIYDRSWYNRSSTLQYSVSVSESYRPFDRFITDYNFIASPDYGWNEDKVRVFSGDRVDARDRVDDSHAVGLEFNLIDSLNEDISHMLSTIDNWNNIIGVSANRYRESYSDLKRYRDLYFSRLYDRINFRKFADMLDFFDRSFVKMVQRLLPARAVFYGEEFVVESHMLERSKVQWAYRQRNPEFVPVGVITMIDRSGSDNTIVFPTLFYD
jgi:hypothetical protein